MELTSRFTNGIRCETINAIEEPYVGRRHEEVEKIVDEIHDASRLGNRTVGSSPSPSALIDLPACTPLGSFERVKKGDRRGVNR